MIRKRAELAIRYAGEEGGDMFYFPSLSSKKIVYKGMLTTEQVRSFYIELNDETMDTALALVHSRFSTNTFPSWERAHPYRYIAHNGEINTLRGNVNWMHARQSHARLASSSATTSRRSCPVIDPDGSDSAMFDNVPRVAGARRPLAAARDDDDDPGAVGRTTRA